HAWRDDFGPSGFWHGPFNISGTAQHAARDHRLTLLGRYPDQLDVFLTDGIKPNFAVWSSIWRPDLASGPFLQFWAPFFPIGPNELKAFVDGSVAAISRSASRIDLFAVSADKATVHTTSWHDITWIENGSPALPPFPIKPMVDPPYDILECLSESELRTRRARI